MGESVVTREVGVEEHPVRERSDGGAGPAPDGAGHGVSAMLAESTGQSPDGRRPHGAPTRVFPLR